MAACLPKPALHRGGQKMGVSETRQGLLAIWWSLVLEGGACPAGYPRRNSLSQNNPELLLTSQHRARYSPIRPTRSSSWKLCILVGESGLS